jgi:hypothetical protein
MKGNWQTQHFGFEKHKTDQADKGLAIPIVQFCVCGNHWTKNRRLDFIIEHRQMSPLGGEKNFRLCHFDCANLMLTIC